MTLRVLSAGAVQRGLEAAGRLFEAQSGEKVLLTFATAPAIRRSLETAETAADVILAPVETIQEFVASGQLAPNSRAVVGRVKAGVVVRRDAVTPDISSVEALTRELLGAQSLVYNEGSSGLFVETLVKGLGIADAVKPKTLRFPDADGVMKHIAVSRTAKEIGFGQITAILMRADEGVRLVGPLPKEVESITTYAAAVAIRAESSELAYRFTRFLATPASLEAFKAAGVE
jgi:molybdate transport system substrate-binding protein